MSEENNKLANRTEKIAELAKKMSEDDVAQLYRVQQIQKNLNRAPNLKKVKKNTFANDALYLPIAEVEMQLDIDYFGLWQVHSFTTKTIANEIVGELVLEVFHPVAQVWLKRTGAAAVQIQYAAEYENIEGKSVKKPVNITDISKKIPNTLQKDYPHLKSECLKNAARSLGLRYGRNLNRKDGSDYEPSIKLTEDNHNELRK